MASTNFVHTWQDGDRLFVNINGADIEARSLTVDEKQIVTLRFHARFAREIMPTNGVSMPDAKGSPMLSKFRFNKRLIPG